MQPTRDILDYMNEMNKLFPRNELHDSFHTPSHVPLSHFSQLTPVKSSSSTESTPPDLYPDFTSNFPPRDVDAPYIIRRQRPIYGRRLMVDPPTFDQTKKIEECDSTNIWQYDDSPTQNFVREQRSPRDLYELFPTENKFEFLTPVKNNTHWNISPPSPMPNISPSSNISRQAPLPPSRRSVGSPFGPSTSKYPDRPTVCTFCRKNGETPLVYTTHMVKRMVGEKSIVTCPILRSHICSTCGASGDEAHTITYCPVLRNNNNGLPLQSTTITLKNTRVKSNGKRRY